MPISLFEPRFKALVIGASGGIGQAFIEMLREDPLCALAVGIGRKSEPKIDFFDEQSIGASAEALAAMGSFDLIINAAGMLHGPDVSPEKRLADLEGEAIKTASIELARSNPKAALISMHPGTVRTGLSAPFGAAASKQYTREAVRKMMASMAAVRPDQSGSFLSYDGSELPW